jgi:4'-phosphopantetheinyl transferase
MRRLTLPDTVPSSIEVWLLELNLQMPVSNSDFSLLSEDERRRALQFRRHEDRIRSIGTRAALRRILASRLMVSPNRLRFVTNCHGKLRLQDELGIEFNVSHSGSFAMIALSLAQQAGVSSEQVGVDIERYRDSIDVKSLAAYVFSPLERQSGFSTNEDFIRRWVAKESVLKALGVGISEHLQDISVLPGKESSYRIFHNQPEWVDIHACSIDAPNGYAAALAMKSGEPYAPRQAFHLRPV